MNNVASLVLILSALSMAANSFIVAPSRTLRPSHRHGARASEDEVETSRRQAIATFGQILLAGTFASSSAFAAEAPKPSTIYLTGKYPIVPGEKPRDKSDTKGTRKDPSFLRSISDCKSQCEQKLGPDGYARNKEDCLSECQDICCASYEQCTFNITPR